MHVIASHVISEEGECLSFVLQRLVDSDYNPSVALGLNYLFADDNLLVLHLHCRFAQSLDIYYKF